MLNSSGGRDDMQSKAKIEAVVVVVAAAAAQSWTVLTDNVISSVKEGQIYIKLLF